MSRYLETAWEATVGYARYLWRDITEPTWHSYFYLLLAVSLAAWLWELARPWRREQPVLREGFALDGFYLFFNFFGFSLLGYAGVSAAFAEVRDDAFGALGLAELFPLFAVERWPIALQVGVFFVLRDLLHYVIHRVLHRVPALWRVHEVHHSVRQMGFAAHLRFHPFETVVYRTLEWVPLALFGFGIEELFFAHAVALVIGHWNHANVRVPLGPLRYLLNSPQMHLWHHAHDLPEERLAKHGGVNFGLSLSLWDYLFGTAFVPREDPDLRLGFPGVDRYPRGFFGHLVAPFRRR